MLQGVADCTLVVTGSILVSTKGNQEKGKEMTDYERGYRDALEKLQLVVLFDLNKYNEGEATEKMIKAELTLEDSYECGEAHGYGECQREIMNHVSDEIKRLYHKVEERVQDEWDIQHKGWN